MPVPTDRFPTDRFATDRTRESGQVEGMVAAKMHQRHIYLLSVLLTPVIVWTAVPAVEVLQGGSGIHVWWDSCQSDDVAERSFLRRVRLARLQGVAGTGCRRSSLVFKRPVSCISMF